MLVLPYAAWHNTISVFYCTMTFIYIDSLKEYMIYIQCLLSVGMLALHYAAWQGMSDPVHTLLQWKSPVNEVSQDGNTPLHLACQHGHFDVVSREGGREGEGERERDRHRQTDRQTDKEKQRGRGDGQPDRFFYFKWCVIRESVSF